MDYLSTRGGPERLPFQDTILTGLARDGGLFLPADTPDVSRRLKEWSQLSYTELALEVMRLYADDLTVEELRGMIARSYATFRHGEITPVVAVGPIHVLELFHGPTLAFKDVALQFLGQLFESVLARRDTALNIVRHQRRHGQCRDPGSARPSAPELFVLHPHGRVSPIQALQMTTCSTECPQSGY